jgi:hypothetical protein
VRCPLNLRDLWTFSLVLRVLRIICFLWMRRGAPCDLCRCGRHVTPNVLALGPAGSEFQAFNLKRCAL